MDNTAFYNRILNGQETEEDKVKFDRMCSNYSDIYKDIYGVRPRDEISMCVNGYSGTPDIEKFRQLLRQGINPLARLYDNTDNDDEDDFNDEEYVDIEDDWTTFEDDYNFMHGNSSKEEIINRHPEFEQYFV